MIQTNSAAAGWISGKWEAQVKSADLAGRRCSHILVGCRHPLRAGGAAPLVLWLQTTKGAARGALEQQMVQTLQAGGRLATVLLTSARLCAGQWQLVSSSRGWACSGAGEWTARAMPGHQ